ncbi:MAG TPA: AAA family ATPase [Bacteroidetes bacterium]|nr:AAA family ATPase [Bacteroidota bacterium]
MTKKRILIGNSNFGYIVSNKGYFVDKTLLVKDFYDNSSQVLLMPRPRRFGKTLNLSMIEHFFDVKKKDAAALFSGYKISGEKAFCGAHQNKYPVINITLKNIRAGDWAECFDEIKMAISELYQNHKYLLKSEKLDDFEKSVFKNIILQTANLAAYKHSLKSLSKYLHAHYGEPAVVLVDEYDTPIISGYTEGYYKEIITFMQVFLGSAFKGNDSLQKGLITGIMRIAKESIFSELNNLGVFTITSLAFSDKFGFTEGETKKLLAYFGLAGNFPGVQQWYNGYKFGNTDRIYNPWSIVSYISRHEEGLRPYWINTGTDPLIKKRVLERDMDNTRDTLQKLISGQTIEKELHEDFVFADFQTDRELLWTLLTFSGYLSQVGHVAEETYRLRIPNFEITKVFKNIVLKWLNADIRVHKELLVKTLGHLTNNRIAEFEKGFKKIMGDTFSYFDTKGEPENVYQAYVLGMLAIIGDDYVIRSNRESGGGRYDILLIPHDRDRYGAVIEIKQLKKGEKETPQALAEKINGALSEAAGQIEKNKYYKELLDHKIKKIIKLPIVFVGKEAFVLPVAEGKES